MLFQPSFPISLGVYKNTPSKSPGCRMCESLHFKCQHLQANSLLQHTASWLGAESLPQQRNMCLKVGGPTIWNSWNHDLVWERSNHRYVELVSNFANCGECFSLNLLETSIMNCVKVMLSRTLTSMPKAREVKRFRDDDPSICRNPRSLVDQLLYHVMDRHVTWSQNTKEFSWKLIEYNTGWYHFCRRRYRNSFFVIYIFFV